MKVAVHVVYLNFSNSFATVSHYIHIDKMKTYGLDKQAVRWIANWLDCWAQRFVISGMKCNCRLVPSGVPLGLILGQYCLNS